MPFGKEQWLGLFAKAVQDIGLKEVGRDLWVPGKSIPVQGAARAKALRSG